MKKIRLDPETLAVQSFATFELPRTRGTVRGADSQVIAPSTNCYPTDVECESGNCAATGATGCCTAFRCELQPWTNGQDTCQTCPSCATCPGMLGC